MYLNYKLRVRKFQNTVGIHTIYRSVLRTTRVLVSQTLRSLSNPLEMNMPVSCGYHWTVCTLYLWRYLLDLPTEHTEGNVHCGTPSVFVTSCMTITPSAPPDNKLKNTNHYQVRNSGRGATEDWVYITMIILGKRSSVTFCASSGEDPELLLGGNTNP